MIDPASNTVVATVAVGRGPSGVGVDSSSGRIYVVHFADNTVSVIQVLSNRVVATLAVGVEPGAVGTVSLPTSISFHAFTGTLEIRFGATANTDSFQLIPDPSDENPSERGRHCERSEAIQRAPLLRDCFGAHAPRNDVLRHESTSTRSGIKASFTSGRASDGIDPPLEPVTLKVGTFAPGIEPGCFTGTGFGPFTFEGVINGVTLQVRIAPTGANQFSLRAEASNASLMGTANPVPVGLAIGDHNGRTFITADIDH